MNICLMAVCLCKAGLQDTANIVYMDNNEKGHSGGFLFPCSFEFSLYGLKEGPLKKYQSLIKIENILIRLWYPRYLERTLLCFLLSVDSCSDDLLQKFLFAFSSQNPRLLIRLGPRLPTLVSFHLNFEALVPRVPFALYRYKLGSVTKV